MQEADGLIKQGRPHRGHADGTGAAKSPADPYFDPIWSRLNEAGVAVTFHVSEATFMHPLIRAFGEKPLQSRRTGQTAWQWMFCYSEIPVQMTWPTSSITTSSSAFPNIKMVSVENGANWLPAIPGEDGQDARHGQERLLALRTTQGAAQQDFQEQGRRLDVGDTLFSDRFDGIPNRVMKTAAAERMLTSRMNIWQIFKDSFGIAKELNLPYLRLLTQVLSHGPAKIEIMMRMSQMLKMHTITLTTGDLETGMTASGMSVGLVHDVPTVAELMERIVEEAKLVQLNLSASMAVSNAVSARGVTHAETG